MIFTFYSYKGGVGRSMAMANVADALARRGLKVCMVDFDLEAPGIEAYFPVDVGTVRARDGLLDLLLAYKRAMSGTGPEDAFTQLDTYLFPIYRRLPDGGRLDLLPAGRRGDAAGLSKYAAELQRFDWQDFFFNWAGSRFFEWLRLKLAERYDVVLVDSRTGVTEMGGVCAYQLADSIVALCAPNRQNVDGTVRAIADFMSPRVRAQRADRPLSIVVVPSRVEQRAEAQVADFKVRFEAAFAGFQGPSTRFWDLMIPYEPAWAFDESTAGRIDPKTGGASVYAPLIALMVELGDFEMGPEPGAAVVDGDTQPSPTLSKSVRSSISFNPTQSVAPADLMLFHPAEHSEQATALELALRAEAIRVQRVAAPVGADTQWARTMQWATQFAAQVVLYDPGTLGSTVDVLRRFSEAPVTVLEVADDMAAALLAALAPGVEPGADPVGALALRLRPEGDDSTTEEAPIYNPYVGERAFDEAEAGWFFGREADVEALVERLAAHAVVTLLGPSGAGKSSLLRAGLLPALRAGGLEGAWQVTLAKATEGLDLGAVLDAAQAAAPRLVFVVDDAEVMPAAARRALVGRAGPDLRVLLAARADRGDAAEGVVYSLEPLRRDEMRRAIVGAADRAGVGLEEGLLDRILDDLDAIATPLSALQSIMQSLFKNRRAGWLTHAAYDLTGYPSGRVTVERAEATWLGLDERGRALAKAMFLRLVSAEGEMRAVTRAELPEGSPVEPYLRARVVWAGGRDGGAIYRLSDGRLPERWSRLADWLDEDASFVRWLDFVQTAQLAGDDVLMTWGELGKAETFAAKYELAPSEAAFVARARDIELRREADEVARGRRAKRIAVGTLVVVLTLAGFLIVQSLRADREADQRRRTEVLSSLESDIELTDGSADLEKLTVQATEVAHAAAAAGSPVDQYWANVLVAEALVKRGDPAKAGRVLQAANDTYELAMADTATRPDHAPAIEQRADRLREDVAVTAALDWADLRQAKFVLVVQLATLCAWTEAPAWGTDCHDFKLDAKTWAKWRPGWEALFQVVHAHEGRVVFVTPDASPTEGLAFTAQMAGKSLEDWAIIGGLIRESDLGGVVRHLDPKRTVMVIPSGVASEVPPGNLYILDAVDYAALCGGPRTLNVVADVPKLTAALDRAAGTQGPKEPFVDAFYPSSQAGQTHLERLMESRGISRDKAERLLEAERRRRLEPGPPLPSPRGEPPASPRPNQKKNIWRRGQYQL